MKKAGKFLVNLILFVLLFSGFYSIYVNGSGNIYERNCLILLGLFVLFGFVCWSNKFGERIFYLSSMFSLIYLVSLWYFRNSLYLILFIVSLLIYLISLPKKNCGKVRSITDEPHSMIIDKVNKNDKLEEKTVKVIKKIFSPGKYLASSNGTVYHTATCTWAKKITESRKIWFDSKDVATEKGYKAHKCV
jgi:hypothetical protein